MTVTNTPYINPISNDIAAKEVIDGTGTALDRHTVTLMELVDPSTGLPYAPGGVSNVQTINAASLPLPTGAATSAKQPALGTAGTPSADVLSVQGVVSGTPIPTTRSEGWVSLPLVTTNAVAFGPMDVSAYCEVDVQITASQGQSFTFQTSLDGVNWNNLSMQNTNSTLAQPANSASSLGSYHGGTRGQYFQISSSDGTKTCTGVVFLRQTPGPLSAMGVTSMQTATSSSSNGWTAKYFNAAATNNATILKAANGNLGGYALVNLNAAARWVNIYNKGTTPAPASDNALLIHRIYLPPNTVNGGRSAENYGPVGIAGTSGLSFATVTGNSDTDNTSVSINDIIGMLYYK